MQSTRGGGPQAARPCHVLHWERGQARPQAQGRGGEDDKDGGGRCLPAGGRDDGEPLQHLPPGPCRSVRVQYTLVQRGVLVY